MLRKGTGNSDAAAYSWTPDSKKIVYWYGNPIRFALLDPVTRQSSDLLSHSTMEIHSVELSPDQRWIAFSVPAGRKRPLWITPYRDGKAGGESEWIPISQDGDLRPWWSPDGNLLYMISRRDGYRCIWARRLDPATKRPISSAFPVYHIHGARVRVPQEGLAGFGPTILPNGLIFSLDDQSGNVWIAEPKPTP